MANLESLSAQQLNKLKASDNKTYKRILAGEDIDINNTVGTVAGGSGGTSAGATVGTIRPVKTWQDYSVLELRNLMHRHPEYFNLLLTRERERIRRKYIR